MYFTAPPRGVPLPLWISYCKRCEAAQTIGISYQEFQGGKAIPRGWYLDEHTQYFIPPNFDFSGIESLN